MKVDPTAIDSPLALIALFVAIIELFLIYPIAKLQGRDRTMLVGFVIGYPIFIAASFFVFLWHKPVNLYKPQTLSESLQQALLPERLNTQLAPDRAAVAALEVKIATIERRLVDVANQMATPAGATASVDVARMADLEKLRADLLARAEASGDISRSGLNSAAKQVQTQQAKSENDRIVLVRAETTRFREWLQTKGAVDLPPIPEIRGVSAGGPSVGTGLIVLGPEKSDHLAPGVYINIVAQRRSFEPDFKTGSGPLQWTTAEYMVTRFTGKDFPDPDGFVKSARQDSDIQRLYDQASRVFTEIARTEGAGALDAGVVRMINEWTSKSDLNSSLSSIQAGVIAAGGDAQRVKAAVAAFAGKAVSLPNARK